MIRILRILFLIITISITSIGQILCVADKKFKYPEIALRAGVTGSFRVVLDIENFTPQNIQISGLDSASNQYLNLFKESLIDNLNHLTYLKDTASLQLKAKYVIRQYRTLSTSFVELIDPDEIRFVAQSRQVNIIADPSFGEPDPNIDSVVIETTVPFKSGKAIPSEILVQRLFDGDNYSTIILRNNYPNLHDEIIAIANRYTRGYFLARGSNARYYYLKFKVEHRVPECGFKQIY